MMIIVTMLLNKIWKLKTHAVIFALENVEALQKVRHPDLDIILSDNMHRLWTALLC
jgi:CheY-like chemotaxis protein